MSVKRKTQRVHTGMKMVGIKSVDELFKIAVSPLADSIEMRNKLEAAMVRILHVFSTHNATINNIGDSIHQK
ncbi:unnamed protein product, partial [Anisakis simplex]|uniref:50S ribosomal protein L22 n=1 Tax=Anisakis simplex TaxID=6269 RepID=A0A0M3J554_ANISI